MKLARLRKTPIFPLLALPYRITSNRHHRGIRKRQFVKWLFSSREETNFTYDLADTNVAEMARAVAAATGATAAEALGYINELESDAELRASIRHRVAASPYRFCTDPPRYARRAGWYAVARITKPSVIVETGLDKGLGAVVLCAALARNADEGHAGRYFGLDINPDAGWMLDSPFGEIVVGDAIESLRELDDIGLLVSDSDHRTAYEASEYLAARLSDRAIVLSDNAHESSALADFCAATGRRYSFFRERPRDHWYPGAGIGFGVADHDGASVRTYSVRHAVPS